MSEFCKQCAEELDLPENDASPVWEDLCGNLTKDQQDSKHWGFPFLCEGCGSALIWKGGECIATQCFKQHGQIDKENLNA